MLPSTRGLYYFRLRRVEEGEKLRLPRKYARTLLTWTRLDVRGNLCFREDIGRFVSIRGSLAGRGTGLFMMDTASVHHGGGGEGIVEFFFFCRRKKKILKLVDLGFAN